MKVIRLRLSESCSEEALIMHVMREARRRTGMSRADFALAIQRRSNGSLPMREGAIRAYEDGIAVPVTNVWHHALALAGVDAKPFLLGWLDHARLPAFHQLVNDMQTKLARIARGLSIAVVPGLTVFGAFKPSGAVWALLCITFGISIWSQMP
jgi:hypothetical protein